MYSFPCGCSFKLRKDLGPHKFPLLDYSYDEGFNEQCPAIWKLFENGLTLGVFQLESGLGQKWCKTLRPTCIAHLSALTAILRPGTLHNYSDNLYNVIFTDGEVADVYGKLVPDVTEKTKILYPNKTIDRITLEKQGKSQTQVYCDRKNGLEPVTHPIPAVKDILAETYGQLVYQEQQILIGQQIAGFSASDADYYLRKSIGKKDSKLLFSCEQKFMEGCEKVGKVNKEEASIIFGWIKAAARYSFNKCLLWDNEVVLPDNKRILLKYVEPGQFVWSPSGFVKVLKKYWNGKKHVFEIRNTNDLPLRCTLDHKILCADNVMRTVLDAFTSQSEIVSDNDRYYHNRSKIKSIKYYGFLDTLDIEVDSPSHAFFVNSLAVSNSHSTQYGIHAFHDAGLKIHAPLHFYTSKLKSPRNSQTPEDNANLIYEAKKFNIEINLPDLRHCRPEFYNDGKSIYFGLSNVKGLGGSSYNQLCEVYKKNEAGFTSNFFEFAINSSRYLSPSVVCLLIESGSVDFLGHSRQQMLHEIDLLNKLTTKEKEKLYKYYDAQKAGVL